ncbi:dihydrodipicolinate synthase family protein [Thermodesulfobacteriota bacterium]
MEALPLPRGLIVDLITPLLRGGDIDGRGLGKHLDRVLPHVQALFIAGPNMGEGKTLGSDQRVELFEKTLVVVRGRIPILVWISRETDEKTRETLLLLKKRIEIRKYTGPVLWVDTPLYYHSNRGLPQHYEKMFTLVEEPFILYNDPELIRAVEQPLKRNNIRTSILKELARMSGIRGLIFFGSLDRAHNYQKAVRSRTDFRIYDGDESHFLDHPSLSGVVSKGANLVPRAWHKITASSLNLNGNQDGYPDYLKQIWDTGGYLNNLKDIYKAHDVPLIKQVLSDMGIIEDPTCSFQVEDITEEKKALRDQMKQYGDYS